jgi:transcriptional regulator with XRE-family HTH domain
MKTPQLFRAFDRESFPPEIRRRRRALDLTQEEFAAMLGMDASLLSRIEAGGREFRYPACLHLSLVALELLGEDAVESAVMREARKRNGKGR